MNTALDTIATRGYQASPVGRLYTPDPYNVLETLTFDTETEMTPAQRLRVGCYIYRVRNKEHIGLFYDNTVLSADEITTLATYAKRHSYNLQTIVGFQIHLLRLVQRSNLAVVGFNLPYDFSRVASRWRPDSDPNKNGFTFSFGGKIDLSIRHLNARKSMYTFHGARKTNAVVIDLMTMGAALSGRSHSLSSLANYLGVEHRKTNAVHGKTLTGEYIDYLVNDVRTTQDCYDSLMCKYQSYQLDTPAHVIYSEASLGKAFLRQFGITPSRWSNPLPDKLQGLIMSTYYGGRSEVHIRRKLTNVTYTDFLSMYPTVCSKMQLWGYVIGQEIGWYDATERVRTLLDMARTKGPELLRNDELWAEFTTIVRIRPNNDVLPVRTKYTKQNYTIGCNRLSSDTPIWYTLTDCIASVFLTGGKIPEVLEAIGFTPGKPQKGLHSISLMGNPNMTVDPYNDDFYRRLIELRKTEGTTKDEQQALKILANSTCYGIFVEMIRESNPDPVEVDWWGYDGIKHTGYSKFTEKPGAWFNPLLASSITGAARLLLATSERLATDRRMEWAFCDTDSFAFVGKPKDIREIVNWFEGLSPYSFKGSILKIEHENVSAYCVSAKRYVLLDNKTGEVVKASAHGLGYLKRPYGEAMTDTGAPEWINHLWLAIVKCKDISTGVDYSYAAALQNPAMSQLTLNTPALYRHLWRYNMKATKGQVIRPFGFLALFQHKLRGKVTALAPLHQNASDTLLCAFDRDTDRVVLAEDLRTYEDVLSGYHMHPESKFTEGNNGHIHILERRHIIAAAVDVIGKEANRMDDALNTWVPTQYMGSEVDPSSSAILSPAPIHIHLKERKVKTMK